MFNGTDVFTFGQISIKANPTSVIFFAATGGEVNRVGNKEFLYTEITKNTDIAVTDKADFLAYLATF